MRTGDWLILLVALIVLFGVLHLGARCVADITY